MSQSEEVPYEEPSILEAQLENEDALPQSTGLTDIIYQSYSLIASGSGPNWSRAEKVITPPARWKRAFVQLIGFDLRYRHEDHHINQLGVHVHLEGAPNSQIKIVAQGIIRDKNSGDSREIRVRAQVVYAIQ